MDGDGTLCMNCDLRARCVGVVAGEAGTVQTRAMLAGRRTLRPFEVLYRPGDPFDHVHVVRNGALVARAGGQACGEVLAFHFAGELAGLDGVPDGQHHASAIALQESEVCTLRMALPGAEAPGARALLARLWDMMSCELLRQRALRARLASLPAARRVSAFVDSARARMRRHGRAPRVLPVALRPADLASYLRLPAEMVA